LSKARPYHLKVTRRVQGKRAANALASEWLALGIKAEVIPGIDPKCTANHFQPGFGGKIDSYCSQCKGYITV